MNEQWLPSRDRELIRMLAVAFKVPAWMISGLMISTPGFPCPYSRHWRKARTR